MYVAGRRHGGCMYIYIIGGYLIVDHVSTCAIRILLLLFLSPCVLNGNGNCSAPKVYFGDFMRYKGAKKREQPLRNDAVVFLGKR